MNSVQYFEVFCMFAYINNKTNTDYEQCGDNCYSM